MRVTLSLILFLGVAFALPRSLGKHLKEVSTWCIYVLMRTVSKGLDPDEVVGNTWTAGSPSNEVDPDKAVGNTWAAESA